METQQIIFIVMMLISLICIIYSILIMRANKGVDERIERIKEKIQNKKEKEEKELPLVLDNLTEDFSEDLKQKLEAENPKPEQKINIDTYKSLDYCPGCGSTKFNKSIIRIDGEMVTQKRTCVKCKTQIEDKIRT